MGLAFIMLKHLIVNSECTLLNKGDTNMPKTATADLHDTEILWKRLFGLL